MGLYVTSFVLLSSGLALGVLGILLAGYRWGDFAAGELRAHNGAKWKAYVASMVPSAAFSLSFHFDPSLAPYAPHAFYLIASASMAGVFLRWHSKNMSGMPMVAL